MSETRAGVCSNCGQWLTMLHRCVNVPSDEVSVTLDRARDQLTSWVEAEDGLLIYDHERGLSPRAATDFEADLRVSLMKMLLLLVNRPSGERGAVREVLVAFALWIHPTWMADNADDVRAAGLAVTAFLEEYNAGLLSGGEGESE